MNKIKNSQKVAPNFTFSPGSKIKSRANQIPSFTFPTVESAVKGKDDKISINAINNTITSIVPPLFSTGSGISPALSRYFNSRRGNSVYQLDFNADRIVKDNKEVIILKNNVCL